MQQYHHVEGESLCIVGGRQSISEHLLRKRAKYSKRGKKFTGSFSRTQPGTGIDHTNIHHSSVNQLQHHHQCCFQPAEAGRSLTTFSAVMTFSDWHADAGFPKGKRADSIHLEERYRVRRILVIKRKRCFGLKKKKKRRYAQTITSLFWGFELQRECLLSSASGCIWETRSIGITDWIVIISNTVLQTFQEKEKPKQTEKCKIFREICDTWTLRCRVLDKM